MLAGRRLGRSRRNLGFVWAGWAALALVACEPADGPVRIGVMLPLSGPSAVGWRESLNVAIENVDRAGGPAGRSVELVYKDLATVDLAAAAGSFLEDPSIVAVIGPDTSAGLMTVAPDFIRAHKPIVSPSATSGDVFRALGGRAYVWRTVQSDVAQADAMLAVAARRSARSIALIYADDTYGATFFDWVGFLGTEDGLEVRALVPHLPGMDPATTVGLALGTAPDVLLVVPGSPEDAVALVRAARLSSPDTNLVLSDLGAIPALIDGLGGLAEGVEGTAPGPDPASGFEAAFQARLGHAPPAYAANLLDAFDLIVFGLEASDGAGGEALAMAMASVVNGRGEPVGWDAEGVGKALAAIRAGERPDLAGASGPLDFDRDRLTDPVLTYYTHWRVENGRFVGVETLAAAGAGLAQSLDQSVADPDLLQNTGGGSFRPGPRTGARALIAALSSGWGNYRHQADALAQYRLLRDHGMPDDRIVLVLADDVAWDPRNPEPGVVRNVTGGPNLRPGAVIDYRPGDLGASGLLSVLSGRPTDRFPTVLDSGPGDDVYVFLVGHGYGTGVPVGPPGTGDLLTADALGTTIQAMYDQGRYRRIFVVVETCHGGVLGTRLAAPGALLLAGANPVESSFGCNWDLSAGAWLGDEFAYRLVTGAASLPGQRLDALYRDLFLHVSGSHVSLYNASGFGGASSAALDDFLSP